MNTFYRKVIQTLVAAITITAAVPITHADVGIQYFGGGRPEVGRNRNPGVVPPYEEPYGKSYGDWGAEWWKWALNIPFDHSPILDTTGKDGSLHQSGPVWFLAGTFGTYAERKITVPAGKAIFFPVVNAWNDYPCPDPDFKPAPGQSMYSFLASGAAAQIDPWADDPATNVLSAKVDGVEVKHLLTYRGISKLTKFTADPSNADPSNVPTIDPCITGDEQVAVADGFWIMLEPLQKGQHTITFSAYAPNLYPNFVFDLKVIYHVKVK